MNGPLDLSTIRLGALSRPAKITITLFLVLVGFGYLFGAAQIWVHHGEADGKPGMSADDLRAAFHGLEREVEGDAPAPVPSEMLRQVRPDGDMREYLDEGSAAEVRSLLSWLAIGAPEEGFTRGENGDPSPQAVIRKRCVECHNSDGGEMEDVPYATEWDGEPDYDLVAVVAVPPAPKGTAERKTVTIRPTNTKKLIRVTHEHILTMPVFTLVVSLLFLLTGASRRWKLILGPLPMAALALDFASWWIARAVEPFVFVLAAAGAVFGASLLLQILAVLVSLWLGKTERPAG